MTIRDSQRSKVYAAEKAAFKDFDNERFETVKDIERFVRHVWSSKRVQSEWPQAVDGKSNLPDVSDGRGRRKPCAVGSFEIRIPRHGRVDWILVHELAHIIHSRRTAWRREEASHGWQYCAIYLRLTLFILGREKHDALKASFKAHRVKYKEPVKRAMSPEKKMALVARLAAARAKRAA